MECVENGIATLRCIPVFLENIINMAAVLAGVATIFFIVWGGIRFITSGGDPAKVEGARKTITYAIVGFVIIVLAFVIIKVFSGITGVECRYLGVQC